MIVGTPGATRLTTEVLDTLGAHPFPRLASLLEGSRPPSGLEPLDLTIGEPRSRPPAWLIEHLVLASNSFGSYPPNAGPAWFADAVIAWLEQRFAIRLGLLDRGMIVPTAGAREALFQLCLAIARPSSGRDVIAMPDPHYAPYRGGAAFNGFTVLPLPATRETGYLPDLSAITPQQGRRLAMLYLCTPSNPEGAIASRAMLAQAIALARSFGFLLVVDECYSEIYRASPPPSALEVCAHLGGESPFRNVVVVNSLSKRSSAAGLRVGWVAGDRDVIASLVGTRAFAGGTTPLANLRAGAALYGDEEHVRHIRDGYRDAFDGADYILGGHPSYSSPEAGMFLWLTVRDDENAARLAWEQAGLRVIPGRYLGSSAQNAVDPGRSHIRLAMVYPRAIIESALSRLLPVLDLTASES
jgi:aspartate/methionine/tyrosine aminotransferase